MQHKYQCPHCQKKYTIRSHNLGWLGGFELYCNACPNVLHVSFYDKHPPFRELMKNQLVVLNAPEKLEELLLPCSCGGGFKLNSSKRCKYCNHELDIEDIERQIGYSAFGRPGIIIDNVIESSKNNVWKKIK